MLRRSISVAMLPVVVAVAGCGGSSSGSAAQAARTTSAAAVRSSSGVVTKPGQTSPSAGAAPGRTAAPPARSGGTSQPAPAPSTAPSTAPSSAPRRSPPPAPPAPPAATPAPAPAPSSPAPAPSAAPTPPAPPPPPPPAPSPPPAPTDRLNAGAELQAGSSLSSPNGSFKLIMQTDGNLVLYNTTATPLWASGSNGPNAGFLAMQTDGNLVVYETNGQATWSSATYGNGPSTMIVQDDGNVVVYRSSDGKATWNSGTAGFPASGAPPKPSLPAGGGPPQTNTGAKWVYGIDVSEFQGTIDWASVRASGRGFAIARVSDGFYHDPQFQRNWSEMKAHGIVRGAYQFFRASHDGASQANDFLNQFTLEAGDIPPVADVETMDGVGAGQMAAALQAWCDTVRSRTGRIPVIYTAPGLWNGYGLPGHAGESLWVACWGGSSPTLPNGWSNYCFWQYSDNDTVAGITANVVDGDVFHGDMNDLQAYIAASGGQAGAPSSAPAPAPAPAPTGQTYTVQSGDTLSGIAAAHGVSLAALEAANPQITNPNVIYVGQVINIP